MKPVVKPKKRVPVKPEVEEAGQRSRKQRAYPAWSFETSLALAKAIQEHASGERVARLTLLGKLNKSPTSSQTQNLITNSTKYGLTKGSFAADYLELTAAGSLVSAATTSEAARVKQAFELAISGIKPFEFLYERYKNKRLPAHEILGDALNEGAFEVDDTKECIDIFVVNLRFLGLLKTIAGAETLVSIETRLEEIGSDGTPQAVTQIIGSDASQKLAGNGGADVSVAKRDWGKTCFYITPIGEVGSDERKHSDLFLSQLVEPALAATSLGLSLVRADQIAEPGVITGQIFEFIFKSKLVIVDLSFHNPNVFYEMALRHATKLPIVQICRKRDRLPFDVNQVRTIMIDNGDIYSLLPNMESYKSEIATQVRAAVEGNGSANPVSVFFPTAQLTIK